MESLRIELHVNSKGNSLIKFTTIYPGLVVTRMTKKLVEDLLKYR